MEYALEGRIVLHRLNLLALFVLGMIAVASLDANVHQASVAVTFPSLQTLKLLDYSKVTSDKQGDAMGYSELEEFVSACQAYSKSIDILPRFHEPILTRGETGISVFRRVSPSVVMVVTANFKDDKITESGLGTGVIIDPAGYVLTNWHVIHGFESGIIFLKPTYGTDPDKNSAYGIRLIEQNEQADLALLKIIKPPAGLTAIRLGDMSSVQVAEDIHIIGHPHGQLWSYSTGVVSQIRDNYDWQYADGSKHFAKVLQMQTAINPGNSGGPVLDNNGNMLGLVAMSEEGQNLNYAVAIDIIKDFVHTAMANKSRGTQSQGRNEEGIHYLASTKDGLAVVKTVYSNLVSYTVRDAKGAPLGIVAETSEGAILTGSKANAFGGLSEWVFKPSSGRVVSVKSSGIAPDVVSITAAD
jgi:S1-C subfamily serine protease